MLTKPPGRPVPWLVKTATKSTEVQAETWFQARGRGAAILSAEVSDVTVTRAPEAAGAYELTEKQIAVRSKEALRKLRHVDIR